MTLTIAILTTPKLFDIKQPMFSSPYIILVITIFTIFVLHKAIINMLHNTRGGD